MYFIGSDVTGFVFALFPAADFSAGLTANDGAVVALPPFELVVDGAGAFDATEGGVLDEILDDAAGKHFDFAAIREAANRDALAIEGDGFDADRIEVAGAGSRSPANPALGKAEGDSGVKRGPLAPGRKVTEAVTGFIV